PRDHPPHGRRRPVQRVAVRPSSRPHRWPDRPRGNPGERTDPNAWQLAVVSSPRDPAPHRPRTEGSPVMTITSERRAANHWPGLDVLPTGPRARVSARLARMLFETAVNRLDVTV